MKGSLEEFQCNGFLVLPDVLDTDRLEDVNSRLAEVSSLKAGDRRLLDYEWCRDLAGCIKERLVSERLIAGQYVATLCTYFNKSAETNWGVASHRDVSVPVKRRFEESGWSNWTDKQGIPHVQPPKPFLAKMFAVRLNIDRSGADNGALIVAPCSHRSESANTPSVVVEGVPGTALMMSPLILHSSKKSTNGANRRVLHFLFGPALPNPPVEWFYAA